MHQQNAWHVIGPYEALVPFKMLKVNRDTVHIRCSRTASWTQP